HTGNSASQAPDSDRKRYAYASST
ncbi:MAG: hypothetical protein QOE57_1472, partial [Acidimicrobiaceae bacterium]|nr:hypothetical protein [Acidimicrobiaceae bacterium]